ncbi:MAG: cyclic nucleotide-binding domain-containing protein, partial [Chloroflexales bacterium]|nr:cyclic nucleotide-binding domain-containing protein [Chloroflexales bacterium]
VDSELLCLGADALASLLDGAAPNAAGGEALAAIVRTLEQAPFFRDLPRETLRRLAGQAERLSLPARTPVIRQGLPSGRLYVIVTGEAAVVRAGEREPGGTAKGRLVARLGPAELFGELELLRGTAPMASVIALTPVELVGLPHSAIAGLLTADSPLGGGLEQIGSGRLRALRQ